MPTDPHRVVLTGENPFIRLSPSDGAEESCVASFWRILFCPAGPGHVLYYRSEMTDGQWRIYSDNIAMTRWLQNTVQGMLDASLKDTSIPVIDAAFSKSGDPAYFWTETIMSAEEEITMTWHDLGDPLLVHTMPDEIPGRDYGVCTVLIPAAGTRLTHNGVQTAGQSWPRERDGRPFSTTPWPSPKAGPRRGRAAPRGISPQWA